MKPEYPQLTLGEERRQTFTNTASSEQLMDLSDIGFSLRYISIANCNNLIL